jgi:hypothetical protein
MSDLQPNDSNSGRRTAFRVIGGVTLLAGVLLVLVAVMDLFSAGSSDSFDAEPTRFWMAFVGVPLLAVGAWLLQAGYVGAVSSYVASETAPAVRETGTALGLRADRERSGSFCRQCGRPSSSDARFCDGCGASLA